MDAALVMSESQESREAWCRRLIDEYDRAVRRLAASVEFDAGRQQDLVQDVWLAIWQALPRFRGECSERTFVYRIAHNRSVSHIDRWVTRRTDPLDAAGEVASAAPDPEREAGARQRQLQLQAAVRALPASLRHVVVLTLEGLSNREVAEVIGISENNVAVRLTRARAGLARALNPEGTAS